ncbi:LutC/YkgG family protein [Confluentibacter flavum]|uniref:Lactate utilization protein B/C n=1 Tax=Confluentibacter flavum TaxID=1909700 RepID=A0A2N3HKS6_9FLAO|nr:LUD domain-containing protein [Confluentibacter flavum]PKQ45458.1 lactate utilization protein B/C [Confluentibacter flavum]
MSRASILNAIKKNKPESVPLPQIDLSLFHEDIDLVDIFYKNLESVGGRIVSLNTIEDLDAEIKKRYPNAKSIVSCSNTSQLATISISNETEPHSLESIDLAIIDAQFGVAENGAVWISENDFIVRALPFIANDLVLILSKNDICLHMHEAYNLISKRERTFGVFLSGPSKTADIEQCLVIGAQGAMSLTVFIF